MSYIGFLVIGAQKAGSSSLFEYMRRHPQIHIPAEKGVNFFNMDRIYRRGFDWYSAMMLRDAPSGAVCGEATVEYMNGTPFGDIAYNERVDPLAGEAQDEPLVEIVPRRIKQSLPDVKLVCVLRDPVERAYSHYRMEVLEKVERRSFEQAVDDLLESQAMERARAVPQRDNGYIANGEYYRGLAGFLRVFPVEQLLVLFSDHLAKEPVDTLAKTFSFIGVDATFVPDNIDTRYREGALKQRIPGLNLNRWQTRLSDAASARALWHAIPARPRASVDRAYRVANYRVAMWNAQRGVTDDGMSSEVRRKLIAHFRPDSEALADMLGAPVPWLDAWS
jgi:Sulfotransferase domain